jgi:hypothetical protein
MLWGCASANLDTTADVTPVAFDGSWFDCRLDAECSVIRDATCHFISVNARHAPEVAEWIDYELTRTRTRDCREREINYVAICDNGKCSSARAPHSIR